MIPCEQCLILPMCKNRRGISCDLLYKWADEHSIKELFRVLPKIISVSSPKHHRAFLLSKGETKYDNTL